MEKCYFSCSTYCSERSTYLQKSVLLIRRLCSLLNMLQCRLHLCWRRFLVGRVIGLWHRQQRHMFTLKLEKSRPHHQPTPTPLSPGNHPGTNDLFVFHCYKCPIEISVTNWNCDNTWQYLHNNNWRISLDTTSLNT